MNKDNYYLWDTNSFKVFINFDFTKDELAGWKFFCTSVQRIEIDRYEDIERRTQLLDIFKKIDPEMIISPAAYYDLAMYGSARYATPENAMILSSLKQEIMDRDLYNEAKGKKKMPDANGSDREINWGADAMVLQAALHIGPNCIVITRDVTMKQVCNHHSIRNANPTTLVEKIKSNG